MALTSHNLLNSLIHRETSLRISKFPVPFPPKPFANPLRLQSIPTKPSNAVIFKPLIARGSLPRVFESEGTVQTDRLGIGNQNLEAFLSISELLFLVSSAVLSIVLLANWAIVGWKKGFQGLLVDGVLAWQAVMLSCAVAMGAWTRRRQWRRIGNGSLKTGCYEVNLVQRIENLEEVMRSSSKVVGALSRQLEKLGIRFRVARKALKEPIAETAALAQKNREATHALAVQEGILVKELGEIQKVLIAMQEQQEKQVELILAICKSGKLLEGKQGAIQGQEAIKIYTSGDGVKKREPLQARPGVH